MIKDRNKRDSSQAFIQVLIITYIFLKENKYNCNTLTNERAVNAYTVLSLKLQGNIFNLII